MLEPSTSVQYVKGIGPRLAEILAVKGIKTVDDLLHYLPFRYEDRLNPRSVAELRAGEMATVIAEVRNSGLFRTRRMPIFQLTVGQGRNRLKCLWFNATYLQGRFQPGQMVALYGKVEADRDGQLQIVQPQFEILGDTNEEGGADEAEKKAAESLEVGRIVPIYESAGQGKLTPRWFRRIIRWALENLNPDLPDPIPSAVRAHLSLISPRAALWQVHWPEAGESFADLLAANVGVSRAICETAVCGLRLEKILLIGSAAEYGVPPSNPVREECPTRPVNAYGLSKVYQTLLASYYFRNHALPIVVARTFNLLGEGMSPLLSIGSLMHQISTLPDKGAVQVGNIDMSRDFLPIEEAVQQYWRLLITGKPGEIYNVCSGVPRTVRSVLEELIAKSGRQLAIEAVPSLFKTADVEVIYGDPTKCNELLVGACR